MKRFLLSVIVATALASSALSGAAFANDNFSINMRSREILYSPEARVAVSKVRTLLDGEDGRYSVVADKAQIDFKTNKLVASGNVYLTFSRWVNDELPEWGGLVPESDDKVLSGADLVVDMEFGEAKLITRDGVTLYIDLNYSRFMPKMKGVSETPLFFDMPDSDIIACYELSYSTTGKFVIEDATYFAPDGSQFYTARVVSDSAELRDHAIELKHAFGAKNEKSTGVPPYNRDFTGEFSTKAVWWLNNEPRRSTYMNIEGTFADRRGFAYFTPTLVQNASLGNTAASFSVSADEIQRSGTVAATMYTGSRNMVAGYYQYEKEDFADEFSKTFQYDKTTSFSLGASIWENDFRVNLSYLSSDNKGNENDLAAAWSDRLDHTHRSGYIRLDTDPLPLKLSPYSLTLSAYLARARNQASAMNFTAPATVSSMENEDLQNSFAAYPTLSVGPIKVFRKGYITQSINYFAYRANINSSLLTSTTPLVFDKSRVTHYSVDADTRLVIPYTRKLNLEVKHNYGKAYGSETASIIPGVSYTHNGKDYIFVGEAFDFATNSWNEALGELAIRRGKARLYYSGRYDLVANAYTSQVVGLAADFAGCTLSASYENRTADFRAALYSEYGFGGRFMEMFHKQKSAGLAGR